MYKLFSIIILYLFICSSSTAQQRIYGRVVSMDNQALTGVNIQSTYTSKVYTTTKDGGFSFTVNKIPDTLLVSAIGYMKHQVILDSLSKMPLLIKLNSTSHTIDEVKVVNTGYYSLPKERLTGSFEHIGEKDLQQSSNPNVIARLEGIVGGLQFDRSTQRREAVNGFSYRLRGLSTIETDREPLIVYDGFPFEGNIEDINPDNIESITVLKDAAASSIWGARAGNGVIVITSKTGNSSKTVLNYTFNTSITDKPNLFYNPNWLDASTVMSIQRDMFLKKRYQELDNIQLPEYVELLIKQRDELIDEPSFLSQQLAFQQKDFRVEASNYLYRPQVNNQHNISINGGGDKARFFLSGFYQGEKSSIVGIDSKNLGISANNQFNLFKGNEITFNINYTANHANNNGLTFNELSNSTAGADIYSSLVMDNGNYATIPRYGIRQTVIDRAASLGLMDWSYSPLLDRDLMDNRTNRNALLLQIGLKQQIIPNWNIHARYQFSDSRLESQQTYDEQSYYTRNLRNRYTDMSTKTSPIPQGSIFEMHPTSKSQQERFRVQSDFNKDFKWKGTLNALVGAEIHSGEQWLDPGSIIYNYNKDLWTGQMNLDYSKLYALWGGGIGTVPTAVVSRRASSSRDLSYYSNISYIQNQKYILSASYRWDGSNLFGVKANQKGTPLWSIGGAWNISEESFFSTMENTLFKLRATYGIAGNMDRTQSSYPTISYTKNTLTGLNAASLSHPGNPLLKWEQVSILNLGVDWRIKRFSGSIEPYWKRSTDLLGNVLLDPTTGTASFSNYKKNYADMSTNGLDMRLAIEVLKNNVNWTISALYSHVSNKVNNFTDNTIVNAHNYLAGGNLPREKRSLDAIYALPWHGLSPETGLPIIYIDNQPSIDYNLFFQNYNSMDLEDMGVTVAPNFLHIQNQIRYKGFQLGGIIASRWGHVFRRSSMTPGGELLFPGPSYHRDYHKRWQKSGDEKHTIVPSTIESTNIGLMNTYKYSAALIEKADVIRIQQINMEYNLSTNWCNKIRLTRLALFANLNNVGIIWRATKEDLDPDYPNVDYPAPFQFSLGLRIQL